MTTNQTSLTGDDIEPGAGDASSALLEGLIVDGSRGRYRVETPVGLFTCTIRGRLRKQLVYPTSQSGRKGVKQVRVNEHDPVAVGDRVRVLPTGGGMGVIEAVVRRAGGAFERRDPEAGGGRLRAVAGIDQVVAVFAAREPTPHLRMLDRFLVAAEAQELASVICINKVDLGIEPWLVERLAVYRAIGYQVVETSAEQSRGLDALRACLAGRTSALLGPSGVGKSSLLNALEPGLGLRVSMVSGSTHKGRHTTTGTRMVPLGGTEGGYLADTAGIRALGLTDAALDRLDWCFPEFRPHLAECHLPGCTHLHEPDCGVRDALRTGAIDAQRYDSYRRMLQGGAGESAAGEWEA